MSNALRFFLRLAVVPALVACLASAATACSGGVASSPAGDSKPASTSGGPSGGSSGAPVVGNEGTAAEKVPGDTATRFELANAFCGAPIGSCGDDGVQIVDFAAATLETHRCVELKDGGGTESIPAPPPGTSPLFGSQRGDAITSRPLTAAEMATLRTALGNVRFASAKLTDLDGAMTVLSVDAPSGNLSLSPVARCGKPDYEQIVDGLPALQAALDAL